jgi:uncharacterized membrane protein (UPF0127 family)
MMRVWILATLCAVSVAPSGSPVGQEALPRGRVVFPDRTVVTVEVAATEAARMRGLMFRSNLAPNEGMLFVFERVALYPFWMKNTLIPLDIIWLDAAKRVVSIAHSVPPCKADPCPSYPPEAESLYVVEVVSGFARAHGVRVGAQLTVEGIPAR